MNTVAPASVFDFDAQPKEEEAYECPLCGWSSLRRISEKDRYGFAQPCDRCVGCGLAFLNPRMTREAYAEFYASGAYRRLVSAFHGREINAETIEPEQHAYGTLLAHTILAPYFPSTVGLRKGLDIGGSTGVVASQIANALGMRMTVLDPSPAELERAARRGLRTALGSFEDYDGFAHVGFDLITLCQTADHLLDVSGALKKIRGLLATDGLFWSDIVDFDVTHEVKIDHPFNLTEGTYREFLRRAGFKLRQINYQPDGKHIGFLCEGA